MTAVLFTNPGAIVQSMNSDVSLLPNDVENVAHADRSHPVVSSVEVFIVSVKSRVRRNTSPGLTHGLASARNALNVNCGRSSRMDVSVLNTPLHAANPALTAICMLPCPADARAALGGRLLEMLLKAGAVMLYRLI